MQLNSLPALKYTSSPMFNSFQHESALKSSLKETRNSGLFPGGDPVLDGTKESVKVGAHDLLTYNSGSSSFEDTTKEKSKTDKNVDLQKAIPVTKQSLGQGKRKRKEIKSEGVDYETSATSSGRLPRPTRTKRGAQDEANSSHWASGSYENMQPPKKRVKGSDSLSLTKGNTEKHHNDPDGPGEADDAALLLCFADAASLAKPVAPKNQSLSVGSTFAASPALPSANIPFLSQTALSSVPSAQHSIHHQHSTSQSPLHASPDSLSFGPGLGSAAKAKNSRSVTNPDLPYPSKSNPASAASHPDIAALLSAGQHPMLLAHPLVGNPNAAMLLLQQQHANQAHLPTMKAPQHNSSHSQALSNIQTKDLKRCATHVKIAYSILQQQKNSSAIKSEPAPQSSNSNGQSNASSKSPANQKNMPPQPVAVNSTKYSQPAVAQLESQANYVPDALAGTSAHQLQQLIQQGNPVALALLQQHQQQQLSMLGQVHPQMTALGATVLPPLTSAIAGQGNPTAQQLHAYSMFRQGNPLLNTQASLQLQQYQQQLLLQQQFYQQQFQLLHQLQLQQQQQQQLQQQQQFQQFRDTQQKDESKSKAEPAHVSNAGKKSEASPADTTPTKSSPVEKSQSSPDSSNKPSLPTPVHDSSNNTQVQADEPAETIQEESLPHPAQSLPELISAPNEDTPENPQTAGPEENPTTETVEPQSNGQSTPEAPPTTTESNPAN